LTEVLLPDTVTEIGMDAFYKCEGITNLVIPDGVTKLGSEALRFMSNLKTLHLPTALGENGIGWGTLSDLPSLEEITLSASCEAHSVVGGILYNKAETEIELIPGAIEHVTLPETVTSITQYTLQKLANVKTIDLGDGVFGHAIDESEHASGDGGDDKQCQEHVDQGGFFFLSHGDYFLEGLTTPKTCGLKALLMSGVKAFIIKMANDTPSG
jgi:hypothetical protein